MPNAEIRFERARVDALLKILEDMAAGDVGARLPISSLHDELDALAHAVNVLVGELSWGHARAHETHEHRASELQAAVTSAEARSSAILRAIPDLMFVMLGDGTFVDYHARDPKILFVPPSVFMGKTVREVLPLPLAEQIMDAFKRASVSDDPAVVEYELPVDGARYFEARIVRAGVNRMLTIVRDVTESKRALQVTRDLARRLISRDEVERQRIARELHDDVSQRVALMNIEIDAIAAQCDSDELRARLRKLYSQSSEIARDVHQMSYELHPSRLRTLGLVAALQLLCTETSKRSLPVGFAHGAIPSSVDADVSLCVYRIVQEALHNVARHSQAPAAQVSITCDEHHLALLVADSGVGFDPARVQPNGLGLVSMRERVANVNGELAIDAVPGNGTRIAVSIPLGSQPVSSAPPVAAT